MPSTSAIVIANPSAARGRISRRWPAFEAELERLFPAARVRWTEAPGHGRQLGKEARDQGCPLVLVAGGDGTISEVVDGLLEGASEVEVPCLGLLPAGTGGDLARTFRIPKKKPILALRLAAEGETMAMDVGCVESPDGRRQHVANIVSFGLSGDVVRRVNASGKRLGNLTFAWSTLVATLEHRPCRVTLRLDDAPPLELELQTLALANGRYFGGGMKVAPDARVDDGLWDVVAIGPLSLARLLLQGHHVFRGTHLGLPHVRHFRARRIEVLHVSDPPPLMEIDGEEAATLRPGHRFEMLPAALPIRVPAGTVGDA